MTNHLKKIFLELQSLCRDEYELIDLCRRHGLVSLLHREFTDDAQMASLVSKTVRDEFENGYYAVAVSNLRRQEELRAILNACASENIEITVLKGMALAYSVYHDIALRPMGDMDLFVRRADAPRLEKMLVNLGYDYYDAERQGLLKKLSSGLQFGKEGRFSLEINWDLVQLERVKGVIEIPESDLWANTVLYDAGTLSFRILRPECQILTLALHHFLHGFIRLIWFNDIAQIISVYGQKIDWEMLLNRARRYSIKNLTWFVLNTACSFFGSSVPDDVLKKIEPNSLKQKIYRSLVNERAILLNPRKRDSSKRYIADVLFMDNAGGQARVLKNIFFPSREWLINHYNPEDQKTGMLRVIHPLRLFRDGVCRIVK